MRHSNRVLLRREESSNAFGLWFISEDSNNQMYVAKPTELQYELKPESFWLGEPTLKIPREIALQLFESFVQQLENTGEALTTNKQVLNAKDENLQDLRKLSDRLLNILDQYKVM